MSRSSPRCGTHAAPQPTCDSKVNTRPCKCRRSSSGSSGAVSGSVGAWLRREGGKGWFK